MYFKRLEIHGFKSFAEPVIIEFHKGVTCVVGPNGSGKSNVCDAIRWVLGAQSAKMLRGDKMEDVIFSGTTNRKSRGMAEVTLVIDNSTGILPIAYNEVAITRRMYRSGESEYLINNNPCRMRDIRELIMDTGIGVEGYSIIGQGKISDIISNNTESIREILEETAGIVMYRSKKAEAERKLSAATSNVERVNDIIGEIEGRIDGLREDSVKATEYLELKDRHRELEINITLKNVESIELKSEYIKDDMTQLKQEMEEKKSEKDLLMKSLSEGNEKREELDRLMEEATAKHLAAVEAVNSLVNQGEVSNERLTAITANRERLEQEITALAEKIEGEENSAQELFSRKEEIDQQLAEKEAALTEKIGEHEALEGALEQKTRELDEKKNRIFSINTDINGKTMEINSLTNLKETLEKREAALLAERGEGDTSFDEQKQALADAEEGHRVSVKSLGENRKLREKHSHRREEIRHEESRLQKEIEALNIEMGQISSRRKTFEEMENNYEGYNSGVKFIMSEGIKGINGVVAELIKVPAGYETAVETALGATMQNIICEDDAAAKEAIGRLKDRKGGRLTFLPLKSLKARDPLRHKGIETVAGFMGYATETVGYDKKYQVAMDYLLGNIVIMETMDQAIALSKRLSGGFKIVTLEGEIINAGGAITGGKYRNKSANILDRRVEMESLGKALEEKSLILEKKKQELTDFREELRETEHAISLTEDDLRESERLVMAKENEINILQTSLSALETGSEKRDKELEHIQREQAESDEGVEKLRLEVEKARSDLAVLEKELEEGSQVFNEEKKIAEDFEDLLTEERIALQEEVGEQKKIDALVDKIKESIEGFQREKQRKEEDLAAQLTEGEEIRNSHKSNEERIEEKERVRDHLQGYLGELREDKGRIAASLDEENAQRDTIEEQLTNLQNSFVELEIKKARGETQLENARNKLWEEFELSYIQAMDFKKKDFSLSSAIKENRDIKSRIKELGEVNVGAIKEYATVSERYEFLTGQRNDIITSMDELKRLIDQMDRTIRSKFKESFDQVVDNFEKVFQELYGGGEAKITLSDESNPFDSEIEIIAQPPGKQLKHINLLSGGEKTMTAIALMFAVLKTKPTPCCILDEVEAALDDSNLNIFGEYLRNFDGVQFTLITHQKATMEHADVMYGITMPESGVSKVYSLRMGDAPLM